MRGLNARVVSGESYASRCLTRGTMTYEGAGGEISNEEVQGGDDNDDEGPLEKEDCFRAMLDLIERMTKEGETYAELRTRVRSQVVDPTYMVDSDEKGGGSNSSSSSGRSSEHRKGWMDEKDSDEAFERWAESLNENMGKVGILPPGGRGGATTKDDMNATTTTAPESDPEKYQFGPDPGVTTHSMIWY